jgi:hypothetical protein
MKLMPIDPNLTIVRDSLELWHDPTFQTSYPYAGTTSYDLSGNDYDGTLTNGVVYNSTNGGNFQLDGVNDFINLGDILNGVIAGTNPKWSVQFWVKFNTLVDNTTYTLISKTPIVNQSRRQFLYMIRNLTASSYGGFQIDCVNYANTGVTNYRQVRTNGAGYTTGVIYNIAITFDGSINTNNGLDRVNIYVNGVAQSKVLGATAGTLTNTFQSATARIGIGAAIDQSGTSSTANIDADYYNMLIYGKTLSAAEVLHNYNVTRERLEALKLLDAYPNADVAYSLRKLRAAYTGSAIRVRRESDNAEQDIGFDANGDLDTSSLATFCSGTNGFVTTWYDQSEGNSNDATQSTAASQPKVYDSSTGVITTNSKPSVSFDGSNDHFSTSLSSVLSQPNSIIIVHKFDNSSDDNHDLIDSFPNADRTLIDTSGNNYRLFAGTSYSTSISATTSQALAFGLIDGSSSFIAINSSASSTSNTGSNGIDTFIIGNTTTRYLLGDIQEFIIYNADESSNRTRIESSINNYYEIY